MHFPRERLLKLLTNQYVSGFYAGATVCVTLSFAATVYQLYKKAGLEPQLKKG